MKSRVVLVIFSLIFSITAFADNAWESYKTEVLSRQNTIHGWCTPEKATRMMDLIYKTSPEVCVEVGVFGGASIYPTASALSYIKKGVVYAIDPWQNSDCLVGYTPGDANYEWWNTIDLEVIYKHFLNMLQRYKLTRFCKVMRTTGAEAMNTFQNESIDILHIDGNHSEEQALADIHMYYPKVKKGGYIWFDDANWTSTHNAIAYLLEKCELDESSDLSDDYLLFRKN